MHHHIIQINQPARCNNFSSFITWRFMYSSTCFGRPHAHPQEPNNCGSSANGRGRAGYLPDHDQQHCYHHASTVKPEAATAVVELQMMGVRTPETCWAVRKTSRNNTWEIVASSCLIYLNYVAKSLNLLVFIINLGVLFTFWHREALTDLCALMCVKTTHCCYSTALPKSAKFCWCSVRLGFN